MQARTAIRALLATVVVLTVVGSIPGSRSRANASELTVESGAVIPAYPTICDSVELVVAGYLSSPCLTISGFSVGKPEELPTMGPVPTYRIPVRIDVQEPSEAAPCPAVIEPYRLTSPLGRLPFGFYLVDATEYVYPWPPGLSAPRDSSRLRFDFGVAAGADTCADGAGCVLLGFGATGFEGPRQDLCTARTTPGGNACFDVTLANPVPVGGLQAEIDVSDAARQPVGYFAPITVVPTPRAYGFHVAWTEMGSTTKIVLYSTSGASIPPGRGAVLHVCYGARSDTPEGVYGLRFGSSLVSSPQGEEIPFCPTFAEVTGRVCVGESHCDLDGNGVGDIRDIVHLVMCVLAPGGPNCPDSVLANADCNGDSSVNVRDVVCCVRDVMAHDGGWGPPPTAETPPPSGAVMGFDGEVAWVKPLEARAIVDIQAELFLGGLQFELDAGEAARIEGVAIEGDTGIFSLIWEPGADGHRARVMLYRNSYAVGTGAGAVTRSSGAFAPLRLVVTLEPSGRVDAGSAGALSIAWPRAADPFGDAVGVTAGVLSVPLPAAPVAGVAAILPARPNPFVSDTEISWYLPAPASASVRLFDVRGRLVRTLQKGESEAGVHRVRWDGRDDRGRTVGVGVYFVRLESGGTTLTNRILRLR